ncbi:MAG: hypothetical protein JJ971_03565 [Balneolaceae bacterium]|nr:hypothetical protein [Balneolaceae bacterium]MBO6545450.1 hypothetical protein [Balneolaceae bacterium]MBO6646846.1 hypothetical protein [Balneolaceae bacterium]
MKNTCYILLFAVITLGACSSNSEDDNSPTISFRVDGDEVNILTRTELRDALDSFVIAYYDTVYEKEKNLRAFLLRDVLELGFSMQLQNNQNAIFTFMALDGFEDSATSDQAAETGGYIAFEDLDVDGTENWEPVVTENNNDPAPFYVVWTGSHQVPDNSYPWPYQLFAINMIESLP